MRLKIAFEFSTAPGPRKREEGKHSGEQFREDVLVPMMREAIASDETLEVDLDGTAGYGTSFLEEAFGGLIRENNFTLAELDAILEFTSDEEPELLEEIREYVEDAEKVRVRGR